MKQYNTPEVEIVKAAADILTVSEDEINWDEE